MNLLFASLIGASCLLGCAASRAQPASSQASAAPEPEAAGESSPTVSSHRESARSASADRSNPAVARASHEPPAPGDAVEIGQFCSEHGLDANLEVERCVSTPLGTRPDAQLWCSRREELDDNRVLYWLALYRVQGRQLAKVTELPYAAGPRPLQERPDEITYYVKLSPDVAADARSVELREEPGFSCDESIPRLREEFSANPDLEKSIEQSVARVCAARGRYAWNGQRQK